MSLPSAWVDRIFDKLTLVYGHQFLGRWSGMDLDVVKADWAHELAYFQQAAHAIAHALEHLPAGDPPTVLQFRQLCGQATRDERQAPLMLDRPEPDPQRLSEALAKLRHQRNEIASRLTRVGDDT